jgi:threonine dehydrogenase-like Zn-dependent dehydrogenase
VGRSIAAIRPGGLVHLVGYAAGTEARFDIFEAIRRDPTIRIATAGSRQSFESLVRLIEEQELRPVIDRTFAVSDFRSALDYFGRGSHFGKVALTF